MKEITFIIPCYNCEKFIIQNHLKLKKKILSSRIKYKIYYINDGSNDLTIKKLYSIKDKNIKIINNNINLGKSCSIIKALKLVKTDFVILLDCDLPYFNYLRKLINELNSSDLVIISRRSPKSTILDSYNFYQSVRRMLGAIIGKFIEIRHKLNVHGDTQSGLKGFKYIPDLKSKKFISKYYFLDVEILKMYRSKNLQIKLIPVKYSISKESNIKIFSFKNIKIIFELIKILYKN
jgi:glycosyltransferase involved in cell wall biosynthesis